MYIIDIFNPWLTKLRFFCRVPCLTLIHGERQLEYSRSKRSVSAIWDDWLSDFALRLCWTKSQGDKNNIWVLWLPSMNQYLGWMSGNVRPLLVKNERTNSSQREQKHLTESNHWDRFLLQLETETDTEKERGRGHMSTMLEPLSSH